MVTVAPIYEAFLSGSWVDLTPDVVEAGGVTMSYGIHGDGPQDLVASSGQCNVLLRNDALNSGKTLGWYSPNHPSVRGGWAFGVPFRVRMVYATVSYTRFTGKVYVILPDTGSKGRRFVSVVAYDVMRSLAEADVREVAIQIGKTEAEVIGAVLDSLPSTEQPIARDLDVGASVFGYALYNLGPSTKALAVIADAARSAFYMVSPKGDGTLIGRSRHTRTTGTSTFAFSGDFTECVVPSDLSEVYNLVKATGHPNDVDPAATTVLYALSGVVPSVPANTTVTFWGTYNDADNAQRLIGGTALVTSLVAYPGTDFDYAGNASMDGMGADLTSYLSVVATAFATTVKFEVTNANPSINVYLIAPSGSAPMLRIRGKGVHDRGPLTCQSSSAQSYGTRPLEMDLPFEGDSNVIQSASDYVQSTYNSLTRRVQKLTFVANESAAKMLLAMTVEPGDRITVTEPVTGVSSAESLVQAVSLKIQERFLTCTLELAPASTQTFWLWGVAGKSEWGQTTIYGF